MSFTGQKITSSAGGNDEQMTNGTTTSTSYTATLTGGTACGVSFVAPASGSVIVHNNLGLFNSGANFSNCTIRVRTGAIIGSGTDFLAASDNYAVNCDTSNIYLHGRTKRVNGLTPGASYNVQQLFRVSGGTGNFQLKELIVEPCA